MNSHIPDFTLLDHTADLGILVRGSDLTNLFEAAAIALIRIMVGGEPSGNTESINISVEGQDLNDLMVRWLGEILYLFEGEERLITDVTIGFISASRLDALVATVPFDPARHEILCEIKAVTYHEIEVVKRGSRWEAKIIFDL